MSNNQYQKIPTGSLFELLLPHFIMYRVNDQYQDIIIYQHDIIVILGLPGYPWNTNLEVNKDDPSYPVLTAFYDGQYAVIHQDILTHTNHFKRLD